MHARALKLCFEFVHAPRDGARRMQIAQRVFHVRPDPLSGPTAGCVTVAPAAPPAVVVGAAVFPPLRLERRLAFFSALACSAAAAASMISSCTSATNALSVSRSIDGLRF